MENTRLNRANTSLEGEYTERELKQFEKRVDRIVKMFKDNGYVWNRFCPITVGKMPDGRMFVMDGVGRCEAARKIAETNPEAPCVKDIPMMVYSISNEHELGQAIRCLNCGNTNWKPEDLFRSIAVENNDEEQLSFFNKIQEISHRLDVPTYCAKLILFGMNSSKRSYMVKAATADADYTIVYAAFDELKKSLDNIPTISEKSRKYARRTDAYMALHGIYKSIIRNSRDSNEAILRMAKLNTAIAAAIIKASNPDMYVFSLFNGKCNTVKEHIANDTLFTKLSRKDDVMKQVYNDIIMSVYGKKSMVG